MVEHDERNRTPEQEAIAIVHQVQLWLLPARDYTADQIRGRRKLRHVEAYLSARTYAVTGGQFNTYKGVRV